MGPIPDRIEPVVLTHAGSERGYLLRMPRRISGKQVPLVLELHGRGIGPAMFDRWTGFGELADEAGFALAMPSAIREIWNDGRYSDSAWGGHTEIDDVGFLLAGAWLRTGSRPRILPGDGELLQSPLTVRAALHVVLDGLVLALVEPFIQ